MRPVEEVNFTASRIQVQKKQVQFRVGHFQPPVNSFCYHVISNTAKRLEAEDVLHSRFDKLPDFAR